jgi:DNA-binding NtrC family response regulator
MNRRIMIVDDDPDVLASYEYHLSHSGYQVLGVGSAEAALGQVGAFAPQVVLTDVRLPGMSGLELLEHLRSLVPQTEVIAITAYEDMKTIIGAIQDGAYDYLVKPIDLDQLDLVVQRCFRDRGCRTEDEIDPQDPAFSQGLHGFVGRDPRMIEIYKMVGMLTTNRAPVLIRGETGTGKEMIARAIHFNSPSAGEPFIAVNCTAIPEALLESELFGHIRGSFTGAVGDRRGRFEMAGEGTIFLDEIGDTSPAFQTKLLRVLQEQEFYPVGSERPRRTQARVIAATHRPIEELMRTGNFREDLYFRLRVVEITVPPLRERRADIPLLTQFLMAKAAQQTGKDVRVIPSAVMRLLQAHDWRGNVRELENTLTRAVLLARGVSLSPEHLGLSTDLHATSTDTESELQDLTLDAIERMHVQRVLAKTGGNKNRTARSLGISRPRLDRLITKHGLVVGRREIEAVEGSR